MIYLKSILVGAAASTLTVIVFSVIVVAVGWFFPEVAVRMFPGSYHALGWGADTLISLGGRLCLDKRLREVPFSTSARISSFVFRRKDAPDDVRIFPMAEDVARRRRLKWMLIRPPSESRL